VNIIQAKELALAGKTVIGPMGKEFNESDFADSRSWNPEHVFFGEWREKQGAPRRFWIIGDEVYSCEQIEGPISFHAPQVEVIEANAYDELKLLWDKATKHVLPGEYDTAESIQKYINDLQKELQRERRKVEKLMEQRDDWISACILADPSVEDEEATIANYVEADDAELEAIDNEEE
jgi:hypothetical protein